MIEIGLIDKNEAKAVLCNPEIYDCITSDDCPPVEDYEPSEALYLGGYTDKLIAVMVFKYVSSVCAECHIQVLPGSRKDHADEFAIKALNWWFKNHGVKLQAEIPEIYPNVIYFGMRHGFKIDGRIDNVHLKNGKLHSMYYLSKEVPNGLG